jgi:hypothetical protein
MVAIRRRVAPYAAGQSEIEAGSFVGPKLLPQMADIERALNEA